MHVTKEQGAYKEYADFWINNAESIEKIQKKLNTELQHLEGLYPPFEEHYYRLKELIEVLTSIYSSINTLEGYEHALRLKALITSYIRRYTREGIDFETLHYLSEKISTLLEHSFENFPILVHHDRQPLEQKDAAADISKHKYRWVTFLRGLSWFMAPFTSLRIFDAKNCEVLSVNDNDSITVRIQDKGIEFKNIFASWDRREVPIRYYLSLDESDNYTATLIGKTIYSKTDIISPKIKSYPGMKHHVLSPGRVRMFGRNHILLS